jgi:hypothetical protein
VRDRGCSCVCHGDDTTRTLCAHCEATSSDGLGYEGDKTLTEHARNVYACMAPVEWNVAAWGDDGNWYVGRVDVADAHRLIRAVIEIVQAGQ